jgi:hypothetical protein
MGDDRRNEVFAQFIIRQFPKAQSILVVADGKGILARKLANKKKKIRVIEDKPRFEGPGHKGITYTKGWFTEDTTFDDDLIVAMHPDEATAEVILAAKREKKPFAIVPCCIKGRLSESVQNYTGWIKKLRSLYPVTLETSLHMNGKNIVLWRK